MESLAAYFEYQQGDLACGAFHLDSGALTIGQVASASSAAAGGGAHVEWVNNLVRIARQKVTNAVEGGGLNLGYCSQMTLLLKQALSPCNRDRVVEEFQQLIGCRDWMFQKELSVHTAARWSGFLKDMAVKMNISNAEGKSVIDGHVAIDGGYNDNSGLAPILADFLQGESEGQILVLIVNELGDHQMEGYFAGGRDNSGGGLMCEGDVSGPQFDGVFQRMDDRYQEGFEEIGGEYIKA